MHSRMGFIGFLFLMMHLLCQAILGLSYFLLFWFLTPLMAPAKYIPCIIDGYIRVMTCCGANFHSYSLTLALL